MIGKQFRTAAIMTHSATVLTPSWRLQTGRWRGRALHRHRPRRSPSCAGPKRPHKVQDCSSARLFGANFPDPFGLTRTPHGGPLGCPATTAPGTGNCLSPVNVVTTLRALALQQGHRISSSLPARRCAGRWARPKGGHSRHCWRISCCTSSIWSWSAGDTALTATPMT